jgi:hypothetical protein
MKIKTEFWNSEKEIIVKKSFDFFFFMSFIFLGQIMYMFFWNFDLLLLIINVFLLAIVYVIAESSGKWLDEKNN